MYQFSVLAQLVYVLQSAAKIDTHRNHNPTRPMAHLVE